MAGFTLSPWEPQLRSLLRIVVGLLYSFHGWQKWFGAFGGLGGGAVPINGSALGFAGPIETIGGALILIGLFTRPTAFILAGQMAVAFFLAHFPRGANPLTNAGEPAVFYCFTFLWLAAAGAGPWSIDALRTKK